MSSKLLNHYLPEIVALGLFRSKPSMVTVNLTNRCNQQCIYCEIGTSPSSGGKDILTIDDILWIIDQMAVNKIHKISLCGGEPFLFDGIIDIVAYAGKKHIRCSITTNGMTAFRLNETELKILKDCKTEINISVDSFQDDILAYTRGTAAALPNALRSIQILKEMHIPVTILTVITKYNFRDLFKFFATAYEHAIKQVLFQPVIYYSNYPDQSPVENKSQLNVPVEEIDILLDELRKILRFERNHKIKTNVYRIFPWISYYLKTAEAKDGKWFFDDVLKNFFCRELYAIIDISYEGGIQPCGLTPASVFIQENRDMGLMALWSQATSKIKNDLINRRYYDCCNGCCHHFSRNMLASIFKHPIENRTTLFKILPLLFSRIGSGMVKKLFLH